MDALEALRSRRSVRVYAKKPLAKEAIEKIVDSARFAPTARGEEPWEFVVVTAPERLAGLAALTDHGPFIRDGAAAIVVCCRDTKYYLEDGCAATENILVAAAALGIGSCWVAGDKKPYCQAVMDFCKVPAGYRLISIIALGYPAKPPAAPQKRLLSSVLHWDSF